MMIMRRSHDTTPAAPSLRMRAGALLLGCSGAVLGCDSSTAPGTDLGPVPDVHFTTDATGYVAARVPDLGTFEQYEFRVITRFENGGATPLWLGLCWPDAPHPLFDVVIVGEPPIRSGYAQFSACGPNDRHFEMPPGAVRVDTLDIRGPTAIDGTTGRPFGVPAGRFRMYFDVRTGPGESGPRAPDSLKLSNEFIVRTSG